MSAQRRITNVFEMCETTVTLSDDGRTLTFTTPVPGFACRTVTVRRAPTSAPFTAAEVAAVSSRDLPLMNVGEKRISRRFHVFGPWWLYVHLNTGPPTWWLPRASLRGGLMVGWFRALVAVHLAHQPIGGNRP